MKNLIDNSKNLSFNSKGNEKPPKALKLWTDMFCSLYINNCFGFSVENRLQFRD